MVVYDHGYHRLSWFDGDGRFVDSMTADAPPLSRLMPDGSFVYDSGDSIVWYDPVSDTREALPVSPACRRVEEPAARRAGWFALAPDGSWGLALSHPGCANQREHEVTLVETDARRGRALSYPLIRELPDQSIGVTTSVILDDRAFVVHGSAYESAALGDGTLILNDVREDRLLVFALSDDPNRPGENS